ncbi:hypothetical protein BpHYR1_028760 [Brachionus plicatilis]|uniref:Uncharacterized protein n=1 Tax=Brachionus plicatilis TaxID=10195 RepID=A0A3M7RSA6_BRAPC|nr:hypothetical protein BpHYR1_028760 [Brachionus plicatilis]
MKIVVKSELKFSQIALGKSGEFCNTLFSNNTLTLMSYVNFKYKLNKNTSFIEIKFNEKYWKKYCNIKYFLFLILVLISFLKIELRFLQNKLDYTRKNLPIFLFRNHEFIFFPPVSFNDALFLIAH